MLKKIVFLMMISVAFLRADELLEEGTLAIGLVAGSGSIEYATTYSSVTKNYFLFGINADFFIIDNLSVGLGIMSWSGNSPTLMEYTLPVMYYFDLGSKTYPYLGVFYRYNDYSGDYSDGLGVYSPKDYQAAGFKAGVVYRVSFGYVGGGVANEYNLENSDTTLYPEFVLGFVF